MSSLFDNKKELQESKGNKIGFIIVTLFLVWLFFPNSNSFIKLSYWSNNLFYGISKAMHINKQPDYIHYRNNAIYLARVYPKNSTLAIKEINKAIDKVSQEQKHTEIANLYKDSAIIKLYYGDKTGALEDYLLSNNYDATDKFRIAILLTDEEKYSEALPYCKSILSYNDSAIIGHICMSYVYEKYGDIQSAERIYDSLVDKKPNSELVYMERSHFKQRIGDEQGRQEDFNKAKEFSSFLKENDASIIDKSINLKELPLSII